LQDIFVRSTMNELKQYFIDSQQNDKELIVFSISKCMGSATLLEFITVYSRWKAEQYIESEGQEVDKRWNELLQAEIDFKDEKRQLQETIEKLEHKNTELEKDIDILSNKLSKSYRRNSEMENNINEMHQELVKQYAFESHIKELLTV